MKGVVANKLSSFKSCGNDVHAHLMEKVYRKVDFDETIIPNNKLCVSQRSFWVIRSTVVQNGKNIFFRQMIYSVAPFN